MSASCIFMIKRKAIALQHSEVFFKVDVLKSLEIKRKNLWSGSIL